MLFRKITSATGVSHIVIPVVASLLAFSLPVWAQDSDGDGIDDIDEGIHNGGIDEVIVNNPGFEIPAGVTTFDFADAEDVPFWITTASDNEIELWADGNLDVPAFRGDQFAELNANEASALFQDIETAPGASLRWSVAHRGRNGTDTAEFTMGPPGAALTLIRRMVSPNDVWSVYGGSVHIPAGQTTTRVQFESIESVGGGTNGNFLDGFELTMVSRDTDADGTPDYQDIDSDNDGIPDAVECPGGLSGCGDFDNDGLFDFRDIDSDNDGIPDNVEVQNTAGYVPPSGLYPADFIDTNNDGLDDTYDETTAAGMSAGMVGVGLTFDSVAGSAHLSIDADGDTVADSIESGIVDQGTGTGDADGDGLQDRYEGADASDGFVVNDEITDPSVDLTNEFGDTTEVAYREALAVPTVNAVTTNNTTPVITGTHTSAADLSVLVDSTTYIIDSNEVLLDNGDDTWELAIPTALSDDSYDVTVTSTSLTAEVVDTTTAELVIDTIPPEPVLTIYTVTDDSILNLSEASLPSYFVTGKVDGEFQGNDTVTLTIGETDYTGSVNASGLYSIEVPIGELAANSLITGMVEATDQAGNNGSATDSQGYLVDVVAPAVTGAVLDSSDAESLELAGTTDEPEGSTVMVNNADGDIICSAEVDANGDWACSASNTENLSQQNLTAIITDSAGNASSSILNSTNAPDADGDGIPDTIEGTVDSDGDSIPDYLDLDSDNDSLLDATESLSGADIDSDDDGIVDRLDLDSDNDGIFDAIENGGHVALDSDNDGRLEGNIGDNGVLDVLETSLDSGVIDLNGDGIADAPVDTDSDSVIDALDIDSDDDGIDDVIEADATSLLPRDTDADGIPDYIDVDSDGDGIADSVEIGGDGDFTLDTDSDGVPDYLDTDSDNDGILDGDEAANVDSDGDGIPDSVEGAVDSDGDGVIDSLDLDSDNDGLTDAYEAGGISDDGRPVDTDGDGIPDYRDRDSDNDGLSDTLESQGLQADADRNGVLDGFLDSDGDGQDDGHAAIPVIPEDIDSDGFPDHLDTDTDGDGTLDLVEGGAGTHGNVDSNNDGALDSMNDSDGDLIPDVVDWDVVGGSDSDGDGIVDSADVDNTGGVDTDGDGIDDASDPDANGDGLADLFSDASQNPPLPDLNGDNIPDVDQLDVSGVAIRAGFVRTGLQAGGCSIASGNGSSDFVLLMLGLLASSVVFIRRKKKL